MWNVSFLVDLRLSLDTEKEEKRMIKEQLVNLEVSVIFCTRSSLDIDFSVLNITTNGKCIYSDFHRGMFMPINVCFQKSSKEQISSLQEEVEKVILKTVQCFCRSDEFIGHLEIGSLNIKRNVLSCLVLLNHVNLTYR